MAQDRIFTFIKGQSKGDKKMKELVSYRRLPRLSCPSSLLSSGTIRGSRLLLNAVCLLRDGL
jgi:hypothetical protein